MNNQQNISKLASEAGRKTGNYLVIVERKPLDPDYEKDLKESKIQITEMLYLYSLRLVKVTETKLVEESVDGDFPYIQYNGEAKYRLELADATDIKDILPDPTDEVIKKALAKFDNTGEITILADHEECLKFIRATNNVNKARIQKVIAKLAALSANYDKVNSLEEARFANTQKFVPVSETIYSLLCETSNEG